MSCLGLRSIQMRPRNKCVLSFLFEQKVATRAFSAVTWSANRHNDNEEEEEEEEEEEAEA